MAVWALRETSAKLFLLKNRLTQATQAALCCCHILHNN
nr:MAG TPA: hypothetical protein [Caudoviricetes sp.]